MLVDFIRASLTIVVEVIARTGDLNSSFFSLLKKQRQVFSIMFSKRRLAGIIIVAALLVAVVGGVAVAQTNSQGKINKTGLYQDFLAKFAENLGVGQDKVVAALDATKKQMLDQAVKDNRITQEQADKIAARSAGNPGWFGRFGDREQGKKNNFKERAYSFKNDMTAKALGITPEQLKSELDSGKKLPQIITDHGLTMEQFRQKMLEIKKENQPKRD